MASSSTDWVAVPMFSEGEPDIPAMKAFRIDEVLPEISSGASPSTARVSSIEPTGVSVTTAAEAVEAVSLMISSPLDNTLTICK